MTVAQDATRNQRADHGASELRCAALEYASLGWRVFPLKPREKKPLTPHGFKDGTTDRATIEAWWTRWPDANIGIATGGGLLVLDVDGLEGKAALSALSFHSDLPSAPSQSTGKGRHYFFRVEFETQNTAGKVGKNIDTRGDGGYVVAAPSVHPNGAQYRWLDDVPPLGALADLPHAPEWLLSLVTAPERTTERPANDWQGDARRPEGYEAYVASALAGEFAKVAGAREGRRNDTLNAAAFSLGTLIGAGVLDEAKARHALEAAAHACGLPRGEAAATITSGLTAGIKEPRDLSSMNGKARDQGTRSEKPNGAGREPPSAAEGPAGGLSGQWLDELAYAYVPEIVEGLIPGAPAVGVVFGPSSAGKTFVVVDWSVRIAGGLRILDRHTKPSGVLYFAAEGQAGLRKRLVAARRAHDLDDVELPFHFLPGHVDIANPEEQAVEKICAYAETISSDMELRGAPLRVIFIDTLSASTPSADENTAKDMGPVLHGFARMAARLNAVVILVHHTGKDETKGLRGWSGIRNNVEFVIECRIEKDADTKETTRRYLYFEKAKDGPDSFILSDYVLRSVTMGVKESGTPDTTCAVEYAEPEASPSSSEAAQARAELERQKLAQEHAMILEGIAQHVTSDWQALSKTAAVLLEAGVSPYGRDRLEGYLKTLASDAHEEVVSIDMPDCRIEVQTQAGAKYAYVKFRVIRDV